MFSSALWHFGGTTLFYCILPVIQFHTPISKNYKILWYRTACYLFHFFTYLIRYSRDLECIWESWESLASSCESPAVCPTQLIFLFVDVWSTKEIAGQYARESLASPCESPFLTQELFTPWAKSPVILPSIALHICIATCYAYMRGYAGQDHLLSRDPPSKWEGLSGCPT